MKTASQIRGRLGAIDLSQINNLVNQATPIINNVANTVSTIKQVNAKPANNSQPQPNQPQYTQTPAPQPTQGKGITTTHILLGIGGAAALGTAAYFLFK